jgi:hypothetical protein
VAAPRGRCGGAVERPLFERERRDTRCDCGRVPLSIYRDGVQAIQSQMILKFKARLGLVKLKQESAGKNGAIVACGNSMADRRWMRLLGSYRQILWRFSAV